MSSDSSSLDYLLPILASNNVYRQVLQKEVSALQDIVKDVIVNLRGRKGLEHRLLTALGRQESHVRSGLMNIRNIYSHISLEGVFALEHDLEMLGMQKVRTQETTARDMIELKKSLWHYWKVLQEKEAQLLVLG